MSTDQILEKSLSLTDAQKEPHIRKLSEELHLLTEIIGNESITIGKLTQITEARGYSFVLLLLSLPFLSPIPLPLVSVPFGGACALIGFRLVFGKTPWLPSFILRRELAGPLVLATFRAAERLTIFLETILRPRWLFISQSRACARIGAIMVTIAGVCLSLPLTIIPFSNFIPALPIFLLAAGELERDGLFFVLGAAAFLFMLFVFSALLLGSAKLFATLIIF